MRNNLLTLMLGLSFVFFGSLVTKAEISNITTLNNKNTSEFNNKSVSELNKKFAATIVLCKNKSGAYCDLAVELADQAAGVAWLQCLMNMDQCADAQEWALGILESAMGICRRESGINASIRKQEKTPFQPSLTKSKEEIIRTE